MNSEELKTPATPFEIASLMQLAFPTSENEILRRMAFELDESRSRK